MRQLNPKHIDALIQLVNSGPYFELLDMKVRELGIGYSKMEVEIRKKHYNPFGAIHGGVYSSIIDSAAYWSAYCELDEHVGFTTVDQSVNYLSMIREGKMIVEGKTKKIGQSVGLAEATATDVNGKILAYGISTLIVLNSKQSLEHAIKAMGYPPLPPKFIED